MKTKSLLQTPHCTVIAAESGVAARYAVATQIALTYQAWQSGENPAPLFLVPPEADLAASAQEVAQLGVYPGTGVLLRTSGSTTGQGKIVALSWEALCASAQATHAYFGAPGAWINVLPLYHIAGFQTIFRSIFAGFSPIIGDYRTIADFQQAIAASSAPRHYLSQVPTQLARLFAPQNCDSGAHQESASSTDSQKFTHCGIDVNLVGGAAIPTNLLQAAQQTGMRIVTSYGMTETCGGCVYDGVPIGDTKLAFAENGQISLCSSTVALGYLGAPDSAAFSVDRDGSRWHHTRDWGQLHDGKLHLNGRIDDAISSGGLTIIPQVLEDFIATHFHTQCVVVGLASEKWGQEVVAVTRTPIPFAKLQNLVRAHFERGWAPQRVYTLTQLIPGGHANNQTPNVPNTSQHSPQHLQQKIADFPLTLSGKIDRLRLTALVAKFAT